MQGRRSTVESLPETFEFDHGSSSDSSGINQQVYWNNILNQVETQNLPQYLLPPSDENMSYMNMSNDDGASLSIWRPGGPSSSEHPLNLGRHDENKMEHEWTSLTITAGGGSRIEQRRFDASNINLNSNQVDARQIYPQYSGSGEGLQAEQNLRNVGKTCETSESGRCSNPNKAVLKLQHASSSDSLDTSMSSPNGAGFMSEDGDDRGLVDVRRLACKRKNIEVFPGQSSSSGSTNFFQQTETSALHSIPPRHSAGTSINLYGSSDYVYGATSSEEQLNPRISTVVRGMAPDCFPSPGIAESSHRSFRLRTNPALQQEFPPPNLFTQGNAIRRSSVWLPNHAPPLLIPFNQSMESRPVVSSSSSQSQRLLQIVPGIPRQLQTFPWNGSSNPRTGSSSNSLSLEERSIVTRDEASSRSILRNNFQEQATFAPTDMRHLVQDPSSWNLAHGQIDVNGNVAPPLSRNVINAELHPLVGTGWVPHQNLNTQYHPSLAEVVRRNLISSSSSDSGGQSDNFLLQHSGSSSNSQETSHQSGGAFRVNQQPYMRSSFLIERQADGVLGVPLSVRSLAVAREGRSRMISEQIRSALDLMRRGENLRLEDVFLLDQSLFFGGIELHDRHRDMRLDVDNMSYEELLALEERIGSVNTGLGEEIVLKHLKQQKYLPMKIEGSIEEEPCCICQEEYVEEQDLGMLDCGHDFHTDCIKQWLMQKNVCPICKTTALVT